MDTSGTYEYRQCENDSTTIGQWIGKIQIDKDSAYFYKTIERTFRYHDNTKSLGKWSKWKRRPNQKRGRDSIFMEIKPQYYTTSIGMDRVTFIKIGSEISPWPQSKNEIPDFEIESHESESN